MNKEAWAEAYMRSLAYPLSSQTEHYEDILNEQAQERMNSTENTYGRSQVPVEEVHSVIDGSKLTTFMACPRDYLFTHLLGWQRETSNIHLVFGSAIHKGMEIIYPVGSPGDFSKENLHRAYIEMAEIFSKAHEEDEFFAETPAKSADQAMLLLEEYASHWRVDLHRYTTEYIEVSGVVPIADNRLIHFNMDRIMRDQQGRISCMEHKTTGRNTPQWADQWDYAFQPGTYFYALFAYYGFEVMKEVLINGLIVRAPTQAKKRNFDFMRIPVKKKPEQISAWVSHANHWYDQIEWNLERLCSSSPDDPYLTAFPPNVAHCASSFGGCKHSGFCHRANPISKGIEPPPGYTHAYWDPRAREVTRYRMDLTQGRGKVEEVKHEES